MKIMLTATELDAGLRDKTKHVVQFGILWSEYCRAIRDIVVTRAASESLEEWAALSAAHGADSMVVLLSGLAAWRDEDLFEAERLFAKLTNCRGFESLAEMLHQLCRLEPYDAWLTELRAIPLDKHRSRMLATTAGLPSA